MTFECPGAKQFKQPTPEFIPCPICHAEVEIWTDEAEVRCTCGNVVSRERLQGCSENSNTSKSGLLEPTRSTRL